MESPILNRTLDSRIFRDFYFLKEEFTIDRAQNDLNALPEHYKTADVDRLIRHYVKEKADTSALRPHILTQQQFHRIYYYVSLSQIKGASECMAFIYENLLFSDWWHTDQLIRYVAKADFATVLAYAKVYVHSKDPFIRRWGYVMFISGLGHGHGKELLPLMHNDDHYYVQMGQAWLIAELAIFEPETVYDWMQKNELAYAVNGKAIQKICDSYRISKEWKEAYKGLRPELKERT